MANKVITDDEIKEALIKAKGVQKIASVLLNCNVGTVSQRVKTNPELQKLINSFKDSGDYLETKLTQYPQTTMFTDDQIIKAIEIAGSDISRIAKYLGTSYKSVSAWLRNRPAIAQKYWEIKESKIDEVEDTLFNLAAGGDINAIKYYLDNNAKHRGYGSDRNINIRQIGFNVNTSPVDLNNLSIEELEMLNALLGKSELNTENMDTKYGNNGQTIIDAEFAE